MIVCSRCGKENQDHYKFCLGCGAELPRESNRPKSFSAPTPPGGLPAASRTSQPPAPELEPLAPPAVAVEPEPVPLPSGVPCPNCGADVPENFRFCHVCGHDLQSDGAPQSKPPQSNGAPVVAPAAAPVAGATWARLILIRPDGSEGEAFQLGEGATLIGRSAGSVFANDAYLSPEHAEFRFEGEQLVVKDTESLNGVYIRIDPEVPIELFDGSVFRVGQEIVRYEAPTAPETAADGTQLMGSPHNGHLGRICLVTGRESSGNCFPIPPQGIHLGRERGDVVFPEDGYVSGLHCRVHAEMGHVFLTDVGSSNGTFVRVRGESFVPSGTFVLMGQQLFRAEY